MKKLSPKFLIFLIVFVNFLGYGIVFPILPLLTVDYGGNPFISGILIGIFSLMQVIFMPILGRLSDRYGRKPLLLFSLWGTALSFLIMGVTHSIFWLLIARIIDGASGGNLSIAQAYIADITNRENRAQGMGIIAAGISLGFIFGPLWGGVFSRFGLAAPFFAATILTILSVFLTQVFLPESVKKSEITYEKKHFDFASFIRHLLQPQFLTLYLINLFLFWAQSGMFTVISLFGKDELHLTVTGTSFLFAFGGILSAVIQGFLIGKTLKIISEKKLLFLSSVTASIGMGILAGTNNLFLFFAGLTIFSVGNSFLIPVIQSLVSEKSSEHEQGGNMGLLQSFGSVGRIFGPVIAGFIYQSVSPFSPAAMGALVFFLITLLGMRL